MIVPMRGCRGCLPIMAARWACCVNIARLCWGAPPHPLGVVDAPVGRHPIHREKMAVVRLVNGREAITHWEILESWNSEATAAPVASLIACRLETGRTHQIRVHMAHIGHPVMGDFVYARGFVTKASQLQPAAQNCTDCAAAAGVARGGAGLSASRNGRGDAV